MQRMPYSKPYNKPATHQDGKSMHHICTISYQPASVSGLKILKILYLGNLVMLFVFLSSYGTSVTQSVMLPELYNRLVTCPIVTGKLLRIPMTYSVNYTEIFGKVAMCQSSSRSYLAARTASVVWNLWYQWKESAWCRSVL